jgi:subtilase family serine protease
MFNAVRRRRGLIAAATLPVAAAMVAGALAVPGSAQAAAASTRPLPGTHPAWATATASRGATPAATTVSAQVGLAGRNPAGLAAYAQAVSSPASAEYHHYLTAAQQEAAFGPTAAELKKVDSWLTRAGLKISRSTEQSVSVTGTATAVRQAFGARLSDYEVSGHVYYAPSSNAAVPADLAGAVLGVSGLDDAPQVARSTAIPAPYRSQRAVRRAGGPPFIGLSPCSTYWGQQSPASLPGVYGHSNPLPVCGYTPKQIRGAYGIAATGLTGQGVTVAVVDAYSSPTIEPDVNTFDRYNGFPPLAPKQFSQIVTPSAWDSQAVCGGTAGWQPEESLDVEAVHTMAPDAKVLYVGANSCQDNDLLSAFDNIVDHRLATIVTDSWGEDLFDKNGNESVGTVEAYTQIFEEAATEGIGFYFSSGDCSTEDPAIVSNGLSCDANSSQPQAIFPASDPWVTAVGATAIGIGAHDNYLFETGMGDTEAALQNGTTWSQLPGTFLAGAGGGTSSYFSQPLYQQGVVPVSLSRALLTGTQSAAPMREVPDVAMEGDVYAATMTGYTQTLATGSSGWAESGVGGTSVSTALFAGIQADAQQAAGVPIGFANPEIYTRYQTLGPAAFRDVTDHPAGRTYAVTLDEGPATGVRQGNLYTLGTDWTLHATAGYDDVTGVGSPTAGYLQSFRS